MQIFDDASALTDALRARDLGSEELLDALLARIDAHNDAVNAVVALDVDRARARAREADRATAAGESWGALHGLPMTVKDSIETEGLVTTSGSPDLRHHVPTRDATAVARLKDAGAIVFGKTNLPLFAGDIQSYNEVYGTTNNPWDLTRTPGGSSGGAAAAVATAMTPLELGSDIGGSIRIPASFTGVCGIKPSFGIVPGRGHIPGPPGSLASTDNAALGPLARSVRDLELALRVLVAPEEDDAPAWRIELPPPRADGSDLRVRVLLEHPDLLTARAVVSTLHAAVDRLADAGVKIEEADAATVSLVGESASLSGLVSAAIAPGLPDAAFDFLCQLADSTSADRQSAAIRLMTSRHRSWLIADEERHKLRARWASWFEDADVLLAPSFATAAIPHQQQGEPSMRTIDVDGRAVAYFQNVWSTAFGVMYLPGVSVPAGLTDDGLPVGMQVVGPYLGDRTALAAAATIEEVLGGYVPPPGYR